MTRSKSISRSPFCYHRHRSNDTSEARFGRIGQKNRRLYVSAMLLLTAAVCTPAQAGVAGKRVNANAAGACTSRKRMIIANRCPGDTLGAKVNAADTMLGDKPGEIRLYGGGSFGDEGSRITISSHHTLRIFAGIYTSTAVDGVISLKDHSALICENASNTILEEPNHVTAPRTDLWSIVNALGASRVDGVFVGQINRNITVKNCRFKGTRSDVSGAQATVQMGNCHGCEVSGNVFDGTHGIGTQWGFSGRSNDPLALGAYAENFSDHHNTYIAVSTVNTAIVNARNGIIHHNRYLSPGNLRPIAYTAAIDLEPNLPTDQIVDISVLNNVMDMYGSVNYIDGVSITNAAQAKYERIVIANNRMYGANIDGSDTNQRRLSVGIRIGANVRDVRVVENRIMFALHPVVVLGNKNAIERNRIFGNVDQANNGFHIHLHPDSAGNVVTANLVSCKSDVENPCSVLVKNEGAQSNVISDNLRIDPPAIVAGMGSGSSPTIAITGDENEGYIDLTTGRQPEAATIVATITFASSSSNVPLSLRPANPNAASLIGTRRLSLEGKNGNGASVIIKAGAAPLAAHTNYRWFYGSVK